MGTRALPQPMQPHGFMGRIFGVFMERFSAPNYAWVVRQLNPVKPKSYLEIGFGTGKLAQLVARKLRPEYLVGLDPSELMFRTAEKRLRSFKRKLMIELKEGDDAQLSQIAGPFDAIVATHSFQFWSDPTKTLQRIHALLSPDGFLILVLRRHGSRRVSRQIPNPITKSGNELGGTCNALTASGFRIAVIETLKTGSHGIVAVRE